MAVMTPSGAYTRAWRDDRGATRAQAYVPLSLAPGEAYQFDWSIAFRSSQ
jgi:hypothetical protein